MRGGALERGAGARGGTEEVVFLLGGCRGQDLTTFLPPPSPTISTVSVFVSWLVFCNFADRHVEFQGR